MFAIIRLLKFAIIVVPLVLRLMKLFKGTGTKAK